MKTRTAVLGAASALILAAGAATLVPAIAAPTDAPPPPSASAPPPPSGGPGERWGRGGPGGYWHGPGWGRHGRGDFREMRAKRIARSLSDQETLIGIRTNQLDAWRDYTDAFLAMVTPPRRDGDARPSRDEPFARAEGLADRAIARGKAAERLKEAVTKLRGALTPEQVQRLADSSREQTRRGPHGGPGRGPADRMDGPGRL